MKIRAPFFIGLWIPKSAGMLGRMRRFAAAMSFLATVSGAAADVRQGVRAWLSGRDDQAIELLTPEAQRADAEAQYFLAEALRSRLNYRAGVIVGGNDSDPAQQEIHGWLEKAARQGHARAMSRYALDLDSGFGVPPDFQAALEWMQKSAASAESPARTLLATWYDTGHIVAPDKAKAEALRAQLAEDRGGRFREPLESPPESRPAVDPLAGVRDLADAKSGNSMAAMRLARAARRGDERQPDCAAALGWYQRAGELGNPDAFDALGDMLYFGGCGEQNLADAHAYFTRGAALASTYSLQRLAGIEMFGHGRAPDLASAYLDLLLVRQLAARDLDHGDAMLRYARARLTASQREAMEAQASARLDSLRTIQARWREQKTTRREVARGGDPARPPKWSYSILRVDDQGHCAEDPSDCERALTETEVRIRNELAAALECTFIAPTPRNWLPPPPDVVRKLRVEPKSEFIARIVAESDELNLMLEDAAGARISCAGSATKR
jgi:TPR repeat protein